MFWKLDNLFFIYENGCICEIVESVVVELVVIRVCVLFIFDNFVVVFCNKVIDKWK